MRRAVGPPLSTMVYDGGTRGANLVADARPADRDIGVRAVGLRAFGGPENLEVLEVADVFAGAGEIRIRVRAAAVNPVDTLFRSGAMAKGLSAFAPPYIPGMDLAGVVDQVGPQTSTDLAVGDPVMAMVRPVRSRGGAYAEYVVLPEQWVVRAPAGSTSAEAATLPLNGLTARRVLDDLALHPGQWLAVTGAAGGVGGYAVQLAGADGLRVLADASESDTDLVAALGPDVVVARGDGLAARIRDHVPGGVDGLIDAAAIGVPVVAAIRDGGRLGLVRDVGQDELITASAAQRDIAVLKSFASAYAGDHAKLNGLRLAAESGVLTLRIARTMPAQEAAEAHRLLARGGIRGRIILTF